MKNLRFNAKRDANEPVIVEHLEKAGCLVNKINGKDLPDLLCLHPSGRFFTVEVKAKGGKLTDGQKDFMANARARDALAFVCQSHDDVKLALVQVAGA